MGTVTDGAKNGPWWTMTPLLLYNVFKSLFADSPWIFLKTISQLEIFSKLTKF